MIVESSTQVFQLPLMFLPPLRDQASKMMDSRKPDYIIGEEDNPYMLRWWLKREADGGCYVHFFLRDDDDRALHDHPWPSLSIILDGYVMEVYAPPGTDPRNTSTHQKRQLGPGSVVERSENFSHRIELQTEGALTLFITGPRLRRWGFWCPQGWRDYKDFTEQTADGSKQGRGCD